MTRRWCLASQARSAAPGGGGAMSADCHLLDQGASASVSEPSGPPVAARDVVFSGPGSPAPPDDAGCASAAAKLGDMPQDRHDWDGAHDIAPACPPDADGWR